MNGANYAIGPRGSVVPVDVFIATNAGWQGLERHTDEPRDVGRGRVGALALAGRIGEARERARDRKATT